MATGTDPETVEVSAPVGPKVDAVATVTLVAFDQGYEQGLKAGAALAQAPVLTALAEALSKAQRAIKGAVKDSENPFFRSRYADLASVWEACREALTSNGLAVVQLPEIVTFGDPVLRNVTSKAGEMRTVVEVLTKVAVRTRLLHASGESIENQISTLLPSAEPQAIGSAITYLRRYALSAMVGVAPEDDDAEGASGQEKVSGVAGAGKAADTRPITAPQLNRMRTILREHGVTGEVAGEFGVWVHATFGAEKGEEVQRKDYDAICAAAESGSWKTAAPAAKAAE